jgi:hypothetical protein
MAALNGFADSVMPTSPPGKRPGRRSCWSRRRESRTVLAQAQSALSDASARPDDRVGDRQLVADPTTRAARDDG